MADGISVAHLVITGIATLASGAIGGWVAAIKSGRRQQKVEDDIDGLQRELNGSARKTFVDQALQAERTGRERIHRDIEDIGKRLEAGDTEMKEHLVTLTQVSTELKGTACELRAYRDQIAHLPTLAGCEATQKACDRRITAVEAAVARLGAAR